MTNAIHDRNVEYMFASFGAFNGKKILSSNKKKGNFNAPTTKNIKKYEPPFLFYA